MILSIKDISKSFENKKALDGISFAMDKGEIIALLGPSGCGKSTLLAIIAGLMMPDKGEVSWNGISMANTPPHLREFGLMFQDFALFPHMNVFDNIAFGLKMAHMDPESIKQRVDEMLSLMGLDDFYYRDVNTLSGGEQQRIALARAMAPHPRLLMLDEPLGSLDRNLRERLVIDVKNILLKMNQTAIYVTHDQEEAFTIADRVILMNSGRLEQIGKPQEIYRNPGSIFVARFLEMNNIIPGSVVHHDGTYQVTTAIGNFPADPSINGDVNLLILPDLAYLDGNGSVKLEGTIKEISFRGSIQKITILINQIPLVFELPSRINLPSPGSDVMISLDSSTAIKIFPRE